jgi:hypothetical protein
MCEQDQDTRERAGVNAGATGVPSDEVGHGGGLDPQSARDDDDTPGDDEAFADRPTHRPDGDGRTGDDGVAIQRPPADS